MIRFWFYFFLLAYWRFWLEFRKFLLNFLQNVRPYSHYANSVSDHFQKNSKISILDPLPCGFAKVIIYSVITETHNLVKNEVEPHTKYLNRIYIWHDKIDKIKRILAEKFFHVEYNKKFKEKFYQIKDNITDLNKRSPKRLNNIFSRKEEKTIGWQR